MILKGCVRVKTVVLYILCAVFIIGLIALYMSGYECDDCARLEEEIFELECEIEDLKSEISDMDEESSVYYWSAYEAKGYLGYAEECLTGFFGSIDVEEALSGVQLAMECLDNITS